MSYARYRRTLAKAQEESKESKQQKDQTPSSSPNRQPNSKNASGQQGDNADSETDKEEEDPNLLQQQKQTSAVQRLYSSKLVQRFRERLRTGQVCVCVRACVTVCRSCINLFS